MKHSAESPKVSVIIPAYNQGDMLACAIKSALAQTYTNREIIVINDNSPNSITRRTAEQFATQIVYIERDTNGGVAAARNTGLEAATGSLIAWLDQDDIWLPRRLEMGVRTLQDHP
jgi:glycosyltransferase involved in cell wall biosynthesis